MRNFIESRPLPAHRAAPSVVLALLVAGCQPSDGNHGMGFPPPVVSVTTVATKVVPVT
jgi:hypothetical protein